MKDKITFGVIGLLIGIIATWGFANTAVNNHHPGMMNMMGLGSASLRMNNIDQHFIEQMIPHHEDAITMANVALGKAEHQEIKDLAQNIIAAQSAEIDTMKYWYQDWYKQSVPDVFSNTDHGMGSGMMHGGMMGNTADISDLESAKPFDREFIEQMIPHHQTAIMMAQMLQTSTIRPEMKQLAEDIIEAQTKEIEQMRSWYQAWYQ